MDGVHQGYRSLRTEKCGCYAAFKIWGASRDQALTALISVGWDLINALELPFPVSETSGGVPLNSSAAPRAVEQDGTAPAPSGRGGSPVSATAPRSSSGGSPLHDTLAAVPSPVLVQKGAEVVEAVRPTSKSNYLMYVMYTAPREKSHVRGLYPDWDAVAKVMGQKSQVGTGFVVKGANSIQEAGSIWTDHHLKLPIPDRRGER